MGGGDVKLLTALALWFHPMWFLKLLIVMSVLGGLLTLVLFVRHKLRKREGRLAVPYGVAISLAGLWMLGSQHVWPSPGGGILG
jgi:prepilin peptidase CpaA